MGAVGFLVVVVVVLLAATEGAWVRVTLVFLDAAALADDDAVVPFLAPMTVRIGLTIAVPEDPVEETVPVLPLRSLWRVAGRAKGDRIVLAAVAAVLLAVLFAWEGVLLLVNVAVLVVAAPALSGLEGFKGDGGCERYEGC